MSQYPLVSVLITTFNRASYVTRAIDSALAQTWPNLEVIVVNDGSTDNTAEVLAAYGTRIRLLSQSNAGLSPARNAAVNMAKGEFIALLDDDDIWLPERLSIQMPHMLHNPDVALVGGRVQCIDEHDNPVSPEKPDNGPPMEVTPGALFTANRISCPTALIRRSALMETDLFDPQLPYAEDYAMWMQIARRHRILVCRQQVALYRTWPDNMTGPGNADKATWMNSHVLIRERALLANEALRKLPTYTVEKHLFWFFRSRERLARDAGDIALAEDLARRCAELQALCRISPLSAAAHRVLHWAVRRLGIR